MEKTVWEERLDIIMSLSSLLLQENVIRLRSYGRFAAAILKGDIGAAFEVLEEVIIGVSYSNSVRIAAAHERIQQSILQAQERAMHDPEAKAALWEWLEGVRHKLYR